MIIARIAPTDHEWYRFLRDQPGLDEVNFWTPSAERAVHAEPFSPWLFKLKAPHNAIAGFGFFARWSRLPDWLAWETFATGNGCRSLRAMQDRIQAIRRRMRFRGSRPPSEIGCVLLVQPLFFAPDDWVRQPNNWPVRTLTPTKYDLTRGEGARVWAECIERAAKLERHAAGAVHEPASRHGAPRLVAPRLGQGAFRIAVMDAYQRACAVTEEHSLPALEAAHLRPFALDGPHDVRNGLLLRADLHRLLDQGYVTVTPSLHLEVSPRLRDDYQNGRSYYPLHGQRVHAPESAADRPAEEFLRWHNETVFRA